MCSRRYTAMYRSLWGLRGRLGGSDSFGLVRARSGWFGPLLVLREWFPFRGNRLGGGPQTDSVCYGETIFVDRA